MHFRGFFTQSHVEDGHSRKGRCVDILLDERKFFVKSAFGRVVELIVVDGQRYAFILVVVVVVLASRVAEVLGGAYALHKLDGWIVFLE